MTDPVSAYIIEILAGLRWEESEDLEFKSARGGLPNDLWATYSAMANTQGGVILLGVQNNGSIIGLTDPAKIKKEFWDAANNRQKISINLLQNEDVLVVPHPYGTLLAIRIRRADRQQRPVYVGQNPLTGTYRRHSEGDYHCTEQEVKRMLADSADESADGRILEHFSLKDLDSPSLRQYRQRLASLQPTHPWLSEDDKGLLCRLSGYCVSRQGGNEGLTVAGLLMFGREETIHEALPHYHVDLREKLSSDPQVRWTDRRTLDGTWPGNLFQFYLHAIRCLTADLKLPFQLDNQLFRIGETAVHEAIREALVNALVHADYRGRGGIIVERHPDRFEFSNPGSLLVSLEQLLRGGVSECRNKNLQKMFALLGVGEKAGSGMDKIRAGWSSQHWRLPMIREYLDPERVVCTLPMVSLIPEKSLERLRSKFGAQFATLSPSEVQALVAADVEGYIDHGRMRQITSQHPADITKCLQGLVGRGMLHSRGRGRGTQYQLPSDANGDSLHKGPDSLHKGPDSLHKGSTPSAHWADLETIATLPRERKRLTVSEMESVIVNLCRDRWLTGRQIGELIRRNTISLSRRFLTPLVKRGILQLRYPDAPNRPDQAYQTAPSPSGPSPDVPRR
jgi:ATP-dependent DNA helicase RecG